MVLPQVDGALSWAYGQLAGAFSGLTDGNAFAGPERYRVDSTAAGDLARSAV